MFGEEDVSDMTCSYWNLNRENDLEDDRILMLALPESIEDEFSISITTMNNVEYNFGKQSDGSKKYYDFSNYPFMGFYGYVDGGDSEV